MMMMMEERCHVESQGWALTTSFWPSACFSLTTCSSNLAPRRCWLSPYFIAWICMLRSLHVYNHCGSCLYRYNYWKLYHEHILTFNPFRAGRPPIAFSHPSLDVSLTPGGATTNQPPSLIYIISLSGRSPWTPLEIWAPERFQAGTAHLPYLPLMCVTIITLGHLGPGREGKLGSLQVPVIGECTRGASVQKDQRPSQYLESTLRPVLKCWVWRPASSTQGLSPRGAKWRWEWRKVSSS